MPTPSLLMISHSARSDESLLFTLIIYIFADIMEEELYYDAIDLLKQLIATPSISRDETKAADIVETFIKKCGYKTSRFGNNIVVIAPEFDASKPTLLLNSHIDTVKPASGWSRDPFSPTEEDGRLYGLGSNDAGASLVSLIAAFRHLSIIPRKYNLVFVASAEEEVSGKNGFSSVISHLPEISVAIVGEPTEMNPAISEKGLMVLDVEVYGEAGHAARNEGINAIYKAVPVIEGFRNMTFDKESSTLGPIKMSVTQIESGTQHNVIPALCKLVVDVRTTDVYSNEETLELIRKNIPDCSITPRSTRLNPSSISADHPLIKRLAIMNRKPFGSPTLSDQALMPWQSVKLGPGKSSRSHTADEYIELDEIREAIHLYITLLTNLTL